MKTPARSRRFTNYVVAQLSAVFVAMLIMMIASILMAPVALVPVVFSPDILAVDPVIPEVRHVTRHPNHFGVAVPITRPMAIKRSVADLNSDGFGPDGGRDNNAHGNDGHKEKFVFDHRVIDHVRLAITNTVLVTHHTFQL
jgi:hypothetical protein